MSDFCPECKEELADEDLLWINEDRGEFWGAPCSETVCVGIKCQKCGYEEEI